MPTVSVADADHRCFKNIVPDGQLVTDVCALNIDLGRGDHCGAAS